MGQLNDLSMTFDVTEGRGGEHLTRDKLKALLEEYGRLAIWVYLVIWLSVLAGFAIAIAAGFGLYLVADLAVRHGWSRARGAKTVWAVVTADE